MVWVIRRGDCAEHGVGIHFRRPGVGCRGYRYIFDRDFSRLGLCRPIRGNSTEAFLRGKTRRMSALTAAAAHPDKFAVLGHVPPDTPDESRELLDARLKQPGFLGLRYIFILPGRED